MKKILVAEDNPAGREFLTEYLTGLGYTVVVALNGHEAVALAAAEMPDLLLLDIQMPELDGYGVLARLRANPKLAGIRVVAFTAYAMPGDKEKAMDAGFHGYITKPIRAAALREEIRALIGDP